MFKYSIVVALLAIFSYRASASVCAGLKSLLKTASEQQHNPETNSDPEEMLKKVKIEATSSFLGYQFLPEPAQKTSLFYRLKMEQLLYRWQVVPTPPPWC